MPYICYEKLSDRQDTLGQSWQGENIPENIKLCDVQPIGRTIIKYLKKTDKILEAGCGLGRWIFYFRDRGYDIIGIEASKRAVQAANNYDPTADIRVGDVKKVDLPDASFDAVISLGVMEHFIEGPQDALKETRRLLKNNGYLFVAIPPSNILRMTITHPLTSLAKLVNTLRGYGHAFSEYRYTVTDFQRHLKTARFEVIDIVTDELLLPRNFGLYTDFPIFRQREEKWALNTAGILIVRFLNTLSDKICRGGVLFICRKLS